MSFSCEFFVLYSAMGRSLVQKSPADCCLFQTWVAWALKHSRLRRYPCLLVLLVNLDLLKYEILINNI